MRVINRFVGLFKSGKTQIVSFFVPMFEKPLYMNGHMLFGEFGPNRFPKREYSRNLKFLLFKKGYIQSK